MNAARSREIVVGLAVAVGAAAVVQWLWRGRRCQRSCEGHEEGEKVALPQAGVAVKSVAAEPKVKNSFECGSVKSTSSEELECTVIAAADPTPESSVCANRMTIIVTTSPVQSNPSTEMLERVINSFELVPGLSSCRKVIVCDGTRISTKNKYRSGHVTETGLVAYEAYIERLAELCREGNGVFANSTLLRLPRRRGFGMAVKTALGRVSTKYVMVVQHDRSFVAPVPLEAILAGMDGDASVKYVGFHTGSTLQYAHKMRTRFKIELTSRELPGGAKVLPMLYWYDSTHICTTEHYLNFVFGPRRLTRGNFIEADLGQAQLKDISTRGMEGHAEYATFLLDNGDQKVVAHMNGRGFLPANVKAELEAEAGSSK